MEAGQNNLNTISAPNVTDLHPSRLRARSLTPPVQGAGVEDVGKTPLRNGMVDSGYGSIASSPDSHKAEFIGRDLLGTELKYLNRPIPDRLKERFFDLKVLYTQPLIDAISKKRANLGDISMKLKYLGNSEQTAELCIVVQCGKKVTKKVKKFFAQEHVQEELKPNFRVFILGKELERLWAQDVIRVLTNSPPSGTLCGVPIRMVRENVSASATLGGLIMAETSEWRLYGLTAGHPLKRFLASNSTLEESESDTEDDEDDSESSDSESESGSSDSVSVLQNECGEEDFGERDDDLNLGTARNIGKVACDTFSTAVQENYDWAVIDLALQDLQPNMVLPSGTHQASHRPRLGQEPAEAIALSVARSHSIPSSKQVTVLCNHGPQTGILTLNSSCLMMNPGSKFVDIHDLAMEPVSRLHPGDSGSWVVDVMTGGVYGHVVSIDAFGEAQVMPIESTLASIKAQLHATQVVLPTPEDVRSIMCARPQHPISPGNETPGIRIIQSTLNPEAEPWVPATVPTMPRSQQIMENCVPQPSYREWWPHVGTPEDPEYNGLADLSLRAGSQSGYPSHHPHLPQTQQDQYLTADPTSPPETPTTSPPASRKHSLKPRRQPDFRDIFKPLNEDPNIKPVGNGHQFSYQPTLGPEQLSPRSSSSSEDLDDSDDDSSESASIASLPGAPGLGLVLDAVNSEDEMADSESSDDSDTDSERDSGASDEAEISHLTATTRTVTCNFVLEDVDSMDSECEGLDVLYPTEIESNRSRTRSSHKEAPKELNKDMMKDIKNLNCSNETSDNEVVRGDSDYDFDENAFLRRREQIRKFRRSMGSSFGKRTHSELSDSDDDGEALDVNDVGSSARRMRRKMQRTSLLFHDPPPARIEELNEPDSSEDELLVGRDLTRELPYWDMEIMEMDSS